MGPLIYWFTIVLTLLLNFTSALPIGECLPVIHNNGINIKNCSGKDLIDLPDPLPDEAEVLDFSRNRFTHLPFIKESNECSEEMKCLVVNMTNHCRLDISFSRNEIYRFDDQALHNLRCLRSLDLSYNEITADIFTHTTFQEGVYYLQKLNLRGNPLGELPDNVISQPYMPGLRDLDLSHCSLKEIGKNSVDDFGELRILNLSFNQLKTIHSDTFKGLTSLDYLDLRQNQLIHIPENVFGDLVNLNELLLSDNQIAGFDKNAFYDDSSLMFLALQNNQLSYIPYSAVDKLPKLHTMDLSQNPIVEVKRGNGYSHVKNLVLDDLPLLKELKPGALTSFPHLVSLSISGNKGLKRIHPGFLTDNPSSLKHVRLENNGLYTLATDALPWKRLQSLKLSSNPWMCDYDLAWMTKAKCIDGQAECSEPLKLRGHPIKTLDTTQLSRHYPITWSLAVVLLFVLLPVFGVCVFLVWKRRHHCRCLKGSLKGRYVSVYTRDMDNEGEQRVAIELKVNVNRVTAVSNGSPDDTKPFIKMDGKESKDDDEDEI